MRTVLAALAALMALVCAAVLTLSGAARASTDWGRSAHQVADSIGCTHYVDVGHWQDISDWGWCYLDGKSVKVITFRSAKGEHAYVRHTIKAGVGPHYWWAQAKGVVVEANNGARRPATIAAHRLPGLLRHGT